MADELGMILDFNFRFSTQEWLAEFFRVSMKLHPFSIPSQTYFCFLLELRKIVDVSDGKSEGACLTPN